MFGRKKKKGPDNYLPYMQYGTALWGIWRDQGNGSNATQVLTTDKRTHAIIPSIFLTDVSARLEAVKLAELDPEHRFKVVPLYPS